MIGISINTTRVYIPIGSPRVLTGEVCSEYPEKKKKEKN